MAGNPLVIKYIPEEQERPYYQGLFKVADVQGKGQIAGGDAVAFFTKSKLSLETLKHIWTVSDQPPTNYLDLPKFAVAVRLIQCMQNGQRGQGSNLATPPGVTMRPAMFDGVSGVTVPFPPEKSGGGGMVPPTPDRAQSRASPSPPTPQMGVGGPSPSTPNSNMKSISQQQPAQYVQQGGAPPTQGRPAMDPRMPMQDPRISMIQQQQGPMSTALTAQDPYIMTPTDLARYETIFKDTANEDGFVYGQQAVALFTKSGMPQQALAAIWNMVDYPVDNRLDKLEFGMAMHLIVCVTRKNLPMPPSLPASLIHIKQQQQQPTAPQQHQPPAPQQHQPPAPQQHQPPPKPEVHVTQQAAQRSLTPVMPAPPKPQQHHLQMPPPQQEREISLENAVSSAALASNIQQPPASSAPHGGLDISDAFADLSPEPMPYLENLPSVPEPEPMPPPMPAPRQQTTAVPQKKQHQPVTVSAPSPVPEPYSGGSSGDNSNEMKQMRELLTRLQAENISLKAQMAGLPEEEGRVQKELATTIAEVARLSSQLAQLRHAVATQKSRFLELTAALKSAKDNAGLLRDLIGEETATKETFEHANEAMEMAVRGDGGGRMSNAPDMLDGGYYNQPPPQQQRPLPGYGQLPPQNVQSAGYGLPVPQISNPESGMRYPVVETLNEDFAHDDGLPPSVREAISGETEATNTMSPVGDLPGQPPAFDFSGLPPPQQQNQHQTLAMHQREMSTASAGFGFHEGDFMGGGSLPAPPQTVYSVASVSPTGAVGAVSPPVKNFDEMRAKAKEADDIAREAEENSRVSISQVSELRKAAEEAEKLLQQANSSDPDKEKKKKGLFRGGGKPTKKEQKVIEEMALDARAKKDALLQAQGQANDAQALAMETRREANRLRKELEEAEIQQASANSIQQQSLPAVNGSKEMQQHQQYIYSQQQHQQPMSSAGGGYSIPAATGDGYDNPFGD